MWVERQHLGEQVDGYCAGVLDDAPKGHGRPGPEAADKGGGFFIFYKPELLFFLRAQHLQNEFQLFLMAAAWKERLAQKKLGSNATGSPDVDFCVVVSDRQDDFRCAVPARHHVLRLGTGFPIITALFGCRVDPPCQPKVTQLKFAVAITNKF